MKIELHFKTVVEIDQGDYDSGKLDGHDGKMVWFPVVFGNSLLKEYLIHSKPFIFTGYNIMPEIENQINRLKTLLK